MIFGGKTIIRSASGNLALANVSSFIHVQLPVPEKKVIFYLTLELELRKLLIDVILKDSNF